MTTFNSSISSSVLPYGDPVTSTIRYYITTSGDTMRISTPRTPASSSASGDVGEFCWDASYFYVCTAANTWQRIALVPF
jgi:hypothetical protein